MKKGIIMAITLLGMLLSGCSIGGQAKGTAEVKTVYILEEGSYVPYYLLAENYDDKYLMLRVEPLTVKQCYRDENTFGSAGGYYNGSDLDNYLSNEFSRRFSEEFIKVIGNTEIEIATQQAVWSGSIPVKTEKISRKFFALSAKEVGIKSNMAADEGGKIAGVDSIEKKEPQWLRSAYIANDISAWVWGEGHYGGEAIASMQYVRPAFSLEKTVKFESRGGIIEGESVLVPAFE